MPTLAVMTARNREAIAILDAAGDHHAASLLRRWLPPWIDVAPPASEWQDRPPSAPGTYPWRRGPDWEPIEREVNLARDTWSWRYWKRVPLETVGGEWLHQRVRSTT